MKKMIYLILAFIIILVLYRLIVDSMNERKDTNESKTYVLSFRDSNDEILMTSNVIESASLSQDYETLQYQIRLNIKDITTFSKITKELSSRSNDNKMLIMWLDFDENKDSYKLQKETCGKKENKKCVLATYVFEELSAPSVVVNIDYDKTEAEKLIDIINESCKTTEESNETPKYDYYSSYQCAVDVANRYNIKNCLSFEKFLVDEEGYIYKCGYNGNINIRVINGWYDISGTSISGSC